MDAVTFEPGGNYRYTGVPIFSYSMRNDSWTFDVGNGVHVYYLEGMSYYQPPFAGTRAKDIDYVDRSNFLRGGLEIPSDKLTPGVVPKIVAFRLECWQNGSLACAYNSLRPDTLNSKMIPVDWFVIGRYPRLFDYVRARCSSF